MEKKLHGNATPQSFWSRYNKRYCQCGKLLCYNNTTGHCQKHQEFSLITRKKMAKAKIGNTYMKGKFGEKANRWKGGITPLNKVLRESSMFKIWREAVFLRDNFTCQNPNCEYCHNKMGVMLHPHHIKPFALFPELRFKVDNGITYCAEYHLNSGLHKGIKTEVISCQI